MIHRLKKVRVLLWQFVIVNCWNICLLLLLLWGIWIQCQAENLLRLCTCAEFVVPVWVRNESYDSWSLAKFRHKRSHVCDRTISILRTCMSVARVKCHLLKTCTDHKMSYAWKMQRQVWKVFHCHYINKTLTPYHGFCRGWLHVACCAASNISHTKLLCKQCTAYVLC